MWNKTVKVICLAAVFAAFGCNTRKATPNGPISTLENYVSKSFAVKGVEDKQALVDMTSGSVKAALETLSDDAFKESFLSKKREFVSMALKDERRLSESKQSVTYEITYRVKSGEAEDMITNKKSAVLEFVDNKWLIAEVKNERTYIEHKNELSF